MNAPTQPPCSNLPLQSSGVPPSAPGEVQSIVRCGQAVMRFYAALDAGNLAEVAGMMADEGVWHRQGKVLQGPAEVLSALRNRPAGRVTAHLVNNLVIDVSDDCKTATARYMLLVFRHDRDPGGTGPAPLAGSLLSITLTTDLWRDVPALGWRAVLKEGQAVFSHGSS